MDTNDLFIERLERINSKIKAYAHYFSSFDPIVDEDDLFQEVMVKLLERYHNEPEFLDNNDSYITCYAAWMMKNYVNHERNMYVKHVTDLETEEGEERFTLPSGHFPKPESQAVRSEVHAIAEGMPNQYRVIFDAITQGYGEQEVADILGISKGALHFRKHNMVETLKEAWRTPIGEREQVIRRMFEWPWAYGVVPEVV